MIRGTTRRSEIVLVTLDWDLLWDVQRLVGADGSVFFVCSSLAFFSLK